MSDLRALLLDAIDPASDAFDKRSRRHVSRFCDWLAQSPVKSVNRHLFLAYGAARGTRAVLSDLERALDNWLTDQDGVRQELRAAVLDHRRRVDGMEMVVDMVRAPWWAPFIAHCDLDRLSILEFKRLDAWLSWMHERGKADPSEEDFLEFCRGAGSEVPLVSLQAAIAKLRLPEIPALMLALPAAIAKKRAMTKGPKTPSPRTSWSRCHSIAAEDLPSDWRATLCVLRSHDEMSSTKTLSSQSIDSQERRLRELAKSCDTSDLPVSLTTATFINHIWAMRARGCSATTCEINAGFLVRFAGYHGVDQSELDEMKAIHRQLKREAKGNVPRKFQRLATVGSVENVLGKASELLEQARMQKSLKLRVSYLNGACALALFALVPLRVNDSNLQWGKNVTYDGEYYRLYVRTGKRGNVFRGPVAKFVTPFLDALLLRGCDRVYLDEFRNAAELEQRHLFAPADGGHLSDRCVANLWARHIGCKPHIARTLVHTELGRMGVEGVAQALALCAQRDPATAKFYQDMAMTDALLLKSNELLLQGFSDTEVEAIFGRSDSQTL
ncbi:hypothetical protein MAA5396_05062 [Marinovum algicola]|uniref:Uncharacterized protein n=1 Tax=Marinovum algicola TaxID=42444 RepID=A0A975WFN8_9RHOB|nr:hypothetical protein [Marinovum algicola]SEK12040.1 hypothetical protein SAMN04487940_1466 [Marinovum algicola]SLN77632.1 hypothetical protein MAA5396_05062 [Marinovum algicola]